MNYLILEKFENNNYGFLTVTNNPMEYFHKFEPIDVRNGAMVVYSQDGVWYELLQDNIHENYRISKNVEVVDTGTWIDGTQMSIKADINLDLHNLAEQTYRSKKRDAWRRILNRKLIKPNPKASRDQLFEIFSSYSKHNY